MELKRSLLTIIVLLQVVFVSQIQNAHSIAVRNEAEAFRLAYDKIKNDELYRKFEHDWIIDIAVTGSNDIKDLIDDGEDAANATGTDAQKLEKITTFLNKYKNDQYVANARLAIGIPLPSFEFDGWRLTPDARGSFEVGASLSITESTGTITIPGLNFTVTGSDPVIQLYAKEDIRYGLDWLWEFGENWWMDTDFYVKQRWDMHEAHSASSIQTNSQSFDVLKKSKNITSTIDGDFRVGYDQEDGFSFWAGFDEIKLLKLSDRRGTVGPLKWGDRPGMRAHVDYLFDLSVVTLTPFAGVHQRSSYDFDDGLYAGMVFEEDLLGVLSVVATADNQYITLHPRFRFWIFQLEYALKTPSTSNIDGYKLHTQHMANFRLAF